MTYTTLKNLLLSLPILLYVVSTNANDSLSSIMSVSSIRNDTSTAIARNPSIDSSSTQNSTDFIAPLPQPLDPRLLGGTIKITSTIEDTRVVINNMELGTTPFCRSGFQPGFYNIVLYNPECHPFIKMVLLEKKGDTLIIDATLEQIIHKKPIVEKTKPSVVESNDEFIKVDTAFNSHEQPLPPDSYLGTLKLSCNVASASVSINKVSLGNAPIEKTGISPGFYEL